MNDLKIFNNPEFGDIRTITINNEPYFVGKDVAEILGYSKARNAIATHLECLQSCFIKMVWILVRNDSSSGCGIMGT